MRTININQPLSHQRSDTRVVELQCGSKVRVDSFFIAFYEALLDMSTAEKIEFLNIDPERMQDYLEEEKKRLIKKMVFYLQKKWTWAETGDPVSKTHDLDYLLPSMAVMINLCRAKNKPNIATLNRWISFFDDKSKVRCISHE